MTPTDDRPNSFATNAEDQYRIARRYEEISSRLEEIALIGARVTGTTLTRRRRAEVRPQPPDDALRRRRRRRNRLRADRDVRLHLPRRRRHLALAVSLRLRPDAIAPSTNPSGLIEALRAFGGYGGGHPGIG